MSIINTKLGGTNASDGDILTAANLNDTFDALVFHRKVFTYATEQTTTSGTHTDVTGATFTLSNPANAILIGLYIKCELKASGAAGMGACLKISGSTLGDYYLTAADAIGGNGFYRSYNPAGSELTSILNTVVADLFGTLGTTYYVFSWDKLLFLKMPDTSTTFQMQYRSYNDGVVTAYMKNVEIGLMYLEVAKDD
jgi:hypothetical protein